MEIALTLCQCQALCICYRSNSGNLQNKFSSKNTVIIYILQIRRWRQSGQGDVADEEAEVHILSDWWQPTSITVQIRTKSLSPHPSWGRPSIHQRLLYSGLKEFLSSTLSCGRGKRLYGCELGFKASAQKGHASLLHTYFPKQVTWLAAPEGRGGGGREGSKAPFTRPCLLSGRDSVSHRIILSSIPSLTPMR